MSRVATPPQTPPTATPKIPHDRIAMRAYEKWCKRGQPNSGSDVQDWLDAEKEIRAEFARTGTGSATTRY